MPNPARQGALGGPVPQRILVVDDEELLRDLLCDLLEDNGFDVVKAENGEVALGRFFDLGPFDLVITDLMMPKMSGSQLIQKIREKDSSCAILVVSAFYEASVNALDLGANKILEKPYEELELIDAVKSLF